MPSQERRPEGVHRLYPRSRFMQRHRTFATLCLGPIIDRIAYNLEGDHRPNSDITHEVATTSAVQVRRRDLRPLPELSETNELLLSRLEQLVDANLVTDQELDENRLLCPLSLCFIRHPLAIKTGEFIDRFEQGLLDEHLIRSQNKHPLRIDITIDSNDIFVDMGYFEELGVFVERKEAELMRENCMAALSSPRAIPAIP